MKLLLMAAAAAVTLTSASPVFAQYNYTRSTSDSDLADTPADDRADALNRRADWLRDHIQQDADARYLGASASDRALDRLSAIRDQQARLERDDGSLTIADAQMIQDRLNRLEDRVRDADAHSRYW